jgi:hypothetical protein
MPQYRRLPVDSLSIDPRYQREIDENHVKKLIKEFDEAALGVLEVSERPDGSHVIFDGQHRWLVLKGVDYPDAPCLVHTGLSPEQEAELFRKQDRRKPVSPVAKFRARLFAGDPIAKGMAEVAAAARYQIGTGPGSIQAVVAAERAYRRDNLAQTLKVIDVWRGDPGSLDGPLMDGLSRFLDLYKEEVNLQHAQFKFGDIGPKTILRRASEFMSSSKAGGVLVVLRDQYSDRQHPLLPIDKAVAARVAQEREGRTRYIRVSAEQVREAVFELDAEKPEGWRVDDVREKLGGVSRPALMNKKTGHLARMIDRRTIRRRMPRDGEDPGWIYFVAPVESTRVNRRRRRPPELDPPAGTEATPGRGMPVRGQDEKKRRQAGSKPGEGHRARLRDKRYEEQQAARAERAQRDKSKANGGGKRFTRGKKEPVPS